LASRARANQPQAACRRHAIISPSGYILTNNHVVEGADDIEVILNDTRGRAKAKVIGTDLTPTLLFENRADSYLSLFWVTLTRSTRATPVLAIGNPSARRGNGDQRTVTLGRKPAGINTFENFIQTPPSTLLAIWEARWSTSTVHSWGGSTRQFYSRLVDNDFLPFRVNCQTGSGRYQGRTGHTRMDWCGATGTMPSCSDLVSNPKYFKPVAFIITGVL
jgi:hypothetical protein